MAGGDCRSQLWCLWHFRLDCPRHSGEAQIALDRNRRNKTANNVKTMAEFTNTHSQVSSDVRGLDAQYLGMVRSCATGFLR